MSTNDPPSQAVPPAGKPPNPPRLWHGWSLGTAAITLFMVQLITGVALMTVYSPAPDTAWGSVWYVQTRVPLGWLVRGLHHTASDGLIIVLACWAVQVVLVGSFRRAHPALWWSLIGLVLVALGLSLSGNLLPWDQDGFWGTRVRTNILARTPVIGEMLRQLVVGGTELGRFTLTRFFTLHVIILPGVMALLFWRRCKVCREETAPGGACTIDLPTQRSKKQRRIAIVSLIAFVGVLCTVGTIHFAEKDALLDAPADAAATDYPARPEWHTRFLYEWLKRFDDPVGEVVGAIAAPSLVILLLLALPLLDRRLPPWLAQFTTVSIILALLGGVGYLTVVSIRADADPAQAEVEAIREKQKAGAPLDNAEQAVLRTRSFNDRRRQARRRARRALKLANQNGIPPEGAIALLYRDPMTRGPELFSTHCATCHRVHGHNGLGVIPVESADSSDLGDFATRSWIRSLLKDPMDDRHFGLMKKKNGDPAHTRMAKWVREIRDEYEEDDKLVELPGDFDAVAAYLEDESLHPRRLASAAISDDAGPAATADPDSDETLIRRGRAFFMAVCNECHTYEGKHEDTVRAPEMAGYGSVEWLVGMIARPSHPSRYHSKGKEPAQMPDFEDRLSASDRRLIAVWLHATRRTGPGVP